jgi:hypothetical protein
MSLRDLSCLFTCSTRMKSAHGSHAGSQQPTLRERPVAHAALLQRHEELSTHAVCIKSIVEALAHVSRRRKVSTCLKGDRRCVSMPRSPDCGGRISHAYH